MLNLMNYYIHQLNNTRECKIKHLVCHNVSCKIIERSVIFCFGVKLNAIKKIFFIRTSNKKKEKRLRCGWSYLIWNYPTRIKNGSFILWPPQIMLQWWIHRKPPQKRIHCKCNISILCQTATDHYDSWMVLYRFHCQSHIIQISTYVKRYFAFNITGQLEMYPLNKLSTIHTFFKPHFEICYNEVPKSTTSKYGECFIPIALNVLRCYLLVSFSGI